MLRGQEPYNLYSYNDIRTPPSHSKIQSFSHSPGVSPLSFSTLQHLISLSYGRVSQKFRAALVAWLYGLFTNIKNYASRLLGRQSDVNKVRRHFAFSFPCQIFYWMFPGNASSEFVFNGANTKIQLYYQY